MASNNVVCWRCRAMSHARALATGIMFAAVVMSTYFDNGSAVAASDKPDPRFVWPTNSQFTCSGVLAKDDGYRLTPDENMLTWCSADFDDTVAARVLGTCKPAQRCEIKGTITGHGTFTWTTINSARILP